MKKIIGWIVLILLTIGSFYIVKDKHKTYDDISTNNTNIEIKIRYKGLKKAVDFTMNDKNIYIGFKNKIMCVPISGEPYNLLEDEKLNISAIELCNDKIYFVSDNSLMSVHTLSGEVEECIKALPNLGDYETVLLKSFQNNLYLTIGAATNSGIVGEDNNWLLEHGEFHDIPSYNIILKANTRGAYVKKDSGNTNKQVIKGETIGTSSIIEYNLGTKEITTYAWGIRNIKGIDINSEGRIFVTVGGYEDRGIRPVAGDLDYIYEIKKGYWYGFPDFSGGDPLTSPRFQSHGEVSLEPLLEEYPMNPPAPVYQHDTLGSLSFLSIDNGNIINLQGNSIIYFYDAINKKVLYSNINGAPEELIKFKGSAEITQMKALNDSLYFLDSDNGFLFTLGMKKS